MADDRTCIYCNIEQWDAVIHISFIHKFFWVEILCNIFIHIKCMPHTVRTMKIFTGQIFRPTRLPFALP